MKNDAVWKIVKGAVIAGLGAALPVLAGLAGALDDGSVQGGLIGAAISIFVNAGYQLLKRVG
jgi:hypothetical protein